MAFNLSKFNQTYFNRLNVVTLSFEVGITESISGTAAIAAEVRATAAISEKVSASAAGQSGVLVSAAYAEEIGGSASLGISALPVMNVSETVSGIVSGAGRYDPPVRFTEDIDSVTDPGAMNSIKAAFDEVISADSILGVLIPIRASFYELVNASANVETTETVVCSIDITLQPGDRLIIDAVNYNVYLNDENVVETHRGEWIDELNRDTINLEIIASSGTENLSASLVYTERFL